MITDLRILRVHPSPFSWYPHRYLGQDRIRWKGGALRLEPAWDDGRGWEQEADRVQYPEQKLPH